jgi:hypothetical protein
VAPTGVSSHAIQDREVAASAAIPQSTVRPSGQRWRLPLRLLSIHAGDGRRRCWSGRLREARRRCPRRLTVGSRSASPSRSDPSMPGLTAEDRALRQRGLAGSESVPASSRFCPPTRAGVSSRRSSSCCWWSWGHLESSAHFCSQAVSRDVVHVGNRVRSIPGNSEAGADSSLRYWLAGRCGRYPFCGPRLGWIRRAFGTWFTVAYM